MSAVLLSEGGSIVVLMPALPTAAEANAALRAYAAGRTEWRPAELRELDRLRAVWRDAVRRETALRNIVTAA